MPLRIVASKVLWVYRYHVQCAALCSGVALRNGRIFTFPNTTWMSEVELKKRLISRIQRSRNSALLREALRLFGTDEADLELYKLNKDQQASIAKGKQDVKAGRTLSSRDADKAVDEWLGK
ncbi:MAG: hypothetical protein IPF95_05570 [Flavobacteriales bacterium]|nr:hypothetical protein [Flavobacteriales bacterium]MBK7295406.1 hypothetical protein [Flavobacteriales bacterium]HQX28452.1 hypothetical protein [Flavobacteriales bacterium]